MARELPRRKHTSKFYAGSFLPAIDRYDWINQQGFADLVRAVLPHMSADEKKDLGMGDQPDGDKVGEDFQIGKFVSGMDQQGTYDLVEDALQHLDEEEIFQLVLDELSPAGRARLLKRLEEEAWKAA